MIIYVLCGVIVLQSVMHHFERKDLYNRLMSKSLSEYKGGKVQSVQSAHDRAIKKWRGKGGENG